MAKFIITRIRSLINRTTPGRVAPPQTRAILVTVHGQTFILEVS